jgi:biphenyl 2,3-dioxygenase subunit beta
MSAVAMDQPTTDVLTAQLLLQHRVEQFLFHEADLLDTWQWRTWYELFTDDVRYWMPVRRNRLRRQRVEDETADRGIEMAHFDANKSRLELRVRQFESGMHWAEDPPSRTRHLVTNVRVAQLDQPGVYEVRSSFLCYRNRLETDVDVWAGMRVDELREAGDSFMIGNRTILLDQNVVLSKNLSVFL